MQARNASTDTHHVRVDRVRPLDVLIDQGLDDGNVLLRKFPNQLV
jgi:hypothetical protein